MGRAALAIKPRLLVPAESQPTKHVDRATAALEGRANDRRLTLERHASAEPALGSLHARRQARLLPEDAATFRVDVGQRTLAEDTTRLDDGIADARGADDERVSAHGDRVAEGVTDQAGFGRSDDTLLGERLAETRGRAR